MKYEADDTSLLISVKQWVCVAARCEFGHFCVFFCENCINKLQFTSKPEKHNEANLFF